MGATDNAFIRVFDDSHELSAKVRDRSRASGVTVGKQSITVATDAALVSEVYAGVAETRPVAVTREESSEREVADIVAPVADQAPTPVGHRHILRLDAGIESPAGPNLRPSVLAQASAATLAVESTDGQSLAEATVTKLKVATIADTTEATDTLTDSEATAESLPVIQGVIEHAILRQDTTSEDKATAPVNVPPATAAPMMRPAANWWPQWEVDRFRWPEICERLTLESANSLSHVVRPILSSAWRGNNVVAVTSFDRQEGSSTMAMCVAMMAASFDVPVALVDGDFENPSIGKSLGMAYEHGWNDMALPLPLKEVAIGCPQEKTVVLPLNEQAGDVEPSVAVHMVNELANHFELVVVDAGPIFTAAYRWFMEPICKSIHSSLIVRDVRETGSHQIEDVCARLESVGIAEVSIVENFQGKEDG